MPHNDTDCAFCADSNSVLQTALAFARFDRFPVSPGHLLIVPYRHVSSYFELTPEERDEITRLLVQGKELLDREYSPSGYNVGINVGEAAGQSVWHAHVHLIPRYQGDHPSPRGGIRSVIPHKQHY